MWNLRQIRRHIGAGTFVAAVSLGATYLFFHSRNTYASSKTTEPDAEDSSGSEHAESQSTDSVYKYCNYPIGEESTFTFDELRENGLKLRGLSISTRHGDRAPLTHFPAHLTTPFCGLWKEKDFALYEEYEKMLDSESKQNILPDALKRFRQLPPNDKCRPGHLTMLGVVQLFRLGRMLRNIYKDIFPLDDQSTEFFLYTTTFARTYQSGLAFLHGIMNPKMASELSFMGTENVNFCSESWCRCPNFYKFNDDFYHEQGEYYRKSGKHIIYMIEKMNHILKTPVTIDAVMCFDNMMGYACHREPLPCLADGDCVTKDMLYMLNSFIIRRYFDLHTKVAGSNKFFLEAFPIMARWQKLLDSLKEDTEKRSFQYFSGHDVSLAPLLAVLGVFDGHIPPYASNLRVEMIEKIETSKIYLRFIYNGDDLTKRVKLCDGNLDQFGKYYLCDAEQFTKYIRRFLNANFQPTGEFSTICSSIEL